MMQIILQKPLTANQLQELMTGLQGFLPPDMISISQNGLAANLASEIGKPANIANCFFLKNKDRYIKIAISDILWVEGDGSSIKIITETGQLIGMLNLRSFLNQVKHPSLLRIHKSFVINTCKLTAFDSGAVYINYKGQEKVLAIGATYRDEFKKQMPRLLSD